jgi:hypothetical protein
MTDIFYVDPRNASIVAGQTPPQLVGLLGLIRFFLIGGILLINGAVFVWYSGQQMLQNADARTSQVQRTTGQLESCRPRRADERTQTGYVGTYRYTVNGTQYALELEIGYCTESQIGMRVPLYYHPDQPTRFHLAPELVTMDEQNNAKQQIVIAFMVGGVGVLSGLMGIVYIFRRRRLIGRYRRAVIADGKVLEVQEEPSHTEYGDFQIYTMRYQFITPQGEVIWGQAKAMREASSADVPYPGTPLKILYVHRRDYAVL